MNCPKCDSEFKNKRGVATHYGIAHDGNLENNECDNCGEKFYSKDTRTKTCESCNPFKGENNHNYKSAKKKSDCLGCGAEIEYYPSAKSGDWCSECQKDRPWVTCDDVPESPDKGNTKTVKCDNCDDKITRSKSDLNERNYCNTSCMGEHRSDLYEGENHPNWEEDYESDYGKGWWSAKRDVLKRDNQMCQKCGATKEELGQNPDVHHIKPLKEFDDKRNAHQLDNLICLCRSCHKEEESKDLSISE